jgi:hypothetical protein
MTNPAFHPTQRQNEPARSAPQQQLIASFDNYLAAQALVDRMADSGFPVEHVRIIGDGVRTVEVVTGRMTKAKAALYGAGSGAWFGLLIGVIFSIFTVGPAWIWALIIPTLIGAFWGAAFGFIAHWSTRGRRDFASVQTLEAQRYDVYVASQYAAKAQSYVNTQTT